VKRDGLTVVHDSHLPSGEVLGFRAEQLRRERTGIHARISLLLDGGILAWDTFNLERSADRIKLANVAWKRIERMEGVKDVLIQASYQDYLHTFCRQAWPTWAGHFRPQLVGDDGDVELETPILSPYIWHESGTIFFAPPGAGKSYTMLAMAQAIDKGVNHLWQVEQTPVCYVNLERGAKRFGNRLKVVNLAIGLPMSERLRITNARGWSLSDVADGIRESVDQDGIRCVFIDSLSRAGYGKLVEDATANSAMDMLNGLGVSWVLVAHSPRQDASHVFGSQMFDAAADVIVQVLSQRKRDGTLGVGLKVTKGNDIAPQEIAIYSLGFDKYGLDSIRPAKKGEFVEIEAEKKGGMVNEVIEWLLHNGPAAAPEVAKGTGYNEKNVSHALSNDPTFLRHGKDGRKVLYVVKETTGRATSEPHEAFR